MEKSTEIWQVFGHKVPHQSFNNSRNLLPCEVLT